MEAKKTEKHSGEQGFQSMKKNVSKGEDRERMVVLEVFDSANMSNRDSPLGMLKRFLASFVFCHGHTKL